MDEQYKKRLPPNPKVQQPYCFYHFQLRKNVKKEYPRIQMSNNIPLEAK